MNKKLLRKLTLSAVTLGVAGVTATTSTFAWFTTNGKATASNITGNVTASDAVVLIKSPASWTETTEENKDKNTTPKTPVYTTDGFVEVDSSSSSTQVHTNFSTSTTLVAEGSSTNALAPVAINSTTVGGGFVERSSETSTHAYTAAANTSHYLHYQVVLAISSLDSSSTYVVKMTLPNLNTSTNAQYLLVDAGTNNKAGSSVNVGIKDVLSIGIKNTIVSSAEDAAKYGLSNGVTLSTSDNNKQYSADASGWYHAISDVTDGADAVTYYNNVYGLSGTTGDNAAISRPKHKKTSDSKSEDQEYSTYYNENALYNVNKKTGDETTIESITCADKVIYKLSKTESAVVVTDLYFFIDGWDYQCFNAVGGMNLFVTPEENKTNDFTFKVEKSN